MKYAYQIQPDGTKVVHSFTGESSRVQWIVASPATRGVLNGNSREVKGALYRNTVILPSVGERETLGGN